MPRIKKLCAEEEDGETSSGMRKRSEKGPRKKEEHASGRLLRRKEAGDRERAERVGSAAAGRGGGRRAAHTGLKRVERTLRVKGQKEQVIVTNRKKSWPSFQITIQHIFFYLWAIYGFQITNSLRLPFALGHTHGHGVR